MTTEQSVKPTELTTLSEALSDTGVALTSAGLLPASTVPAMSDMLQMQSDKDSEVLRGSLLRFNKDGTTSFRMIPTVSEVCTYTGGGTQDYSIVVSDKWSASGKKAKLQQLLEDGLDAVLLGVLTTGSGSGSAAKTIKVGAMAAKLGPPSGAAASAIDKLGLRIGGQTEDLSIDGQSRPAGFSRSHVCASSRNFTVEFLIEHLCILRYHLRIASGSFLSPYFSVW